MRRTTLFFALIATAALLACGCDRGGDTVPLGGDPNALVGDEGESQADIEGDPGPRPIEATWADAAGEAESSFVSFQVKNTTEGAIDYSVSLRAVSLVGEAEKPVGEGTLAAGESESYSVPADDLPVLSSSVVGSLSIRVRRTEPVPGGEREMVEDLATRFVLHAAGYGAVRAYDEAADVIGEVWNGTGYAETAKEDSGLYLRDADGNVYGVVVEMRFDSDLPTDLPDPVPDQGDVTETDVAPI
jgi:hypothetical protein